MFVCAPAGAAAAAAAAWPAEAATTTTKSHAVVLLFVDDRFPQSIDVLSYTLTQNRTLTSLFPSHSNLVAAAAAVCLPTPTPPTDHY